MFLGKSDDEAGYLSFIFSVSRNKSPNLLANANQMTHFDMNRMQKVDRK
ncbi:hypothetical protein AQPE_0866 [Aquipluma nitroreducens]|uniref:Uncharacterized protein n=1 Tax=Aquipluma nitroreducens TaxID=2010828 RepID=A0A5K7S5A5_9BACT|nr:hypothetical protein AQPE_0866 [Aquipluma nitroreducens]